MAVISLRRNRHVLPWLAGVATLLQVEPAPACSVCFGDPESAMAKGAAAGVLVMCGFIGSILLAVAGTGLLWVHRSRRLGGGGAAPTR